MQIATGTPEENPVQEIAQRIAGLSGTQRRELGKELERLGVVIPKPPVAVTWSQIAPTMRLLSTEDIERYILKLLKEGRNFKAIKCYRELTGVRLKEAKEAVEAIIKRHFSGETEET